MGAIENVLKINPNALDARGNLKPLVVQYGEYALAKEFDPSSVDGFTPFVLCMDAGIFGVPGLAGRPLVLSNTSLKHVRVKHGAQIDVLDRLVDEMRENLLAYGDPKEPRNVVFVLASMSERGSRIISIVRARAKQDGVEVSQVRSVHGKRVLDEHITRALDLGREIWTNERTGEWIRNPRNLSADAELSSETATRLLEIHYTHHPDAAQGDPGFSWTPIGRMPAADVERAWSELGDVPVDGDGCLLAPFRGYPAGTDREDIWRDFDASWPEGVYGLMFPGDRTATLDALEAECAASAAMDAPSRSMDRDAQENEREDV